MLDGSCMFGLLLYVPASTKGAMVRHRSQAYACRQIASNILSCALDTARPEPSMHPPALPAALHAGEVIEGLDLAVMRMKEGEKALLTIAPEYAFGDEVGRARNTRALPA